MYKSLLILVYTYSRTAIKRQYCLVLEGVNIVEIKESVWSGFKRLDFEFERRNVILIFPDNPVEGNKWLYKTEYFYAFPNFQIEMIKRGYYLVYMSNKSRLCPEEDTDIRPKLCDFLNLKFGLNKKCFPVGMSCGGMQTVYFAAKYPEYVAAMYLDAPVLNLLSWPLGLGESREPCVEEFNENIGIPVSEMLNYRKHPIDYKETLLKSGIPIFLVCGDSDNTVPYRENGKLLADYFRENNGNLTEIVKPGCDHHPHSLEDLTPLFNFVKKYY